MFVVDCYGHNFSNGVLFAYHIVVDVPGGSSNLGYRRRVRISNNPTTRVNLHPPELERVPPSVAPSHQYGQEEQGSVGEEGREKC